MKINQRTIRPWPVKGIFLLLFLALLTGCSGVQERLWLRAPGWERAQRVGTTTLADPVPIAVDEAHRQLYALLMTESAGGSQPRVVALDRQAGHVWERQLNVTLARPDQPRLLWDGTLLHLFWIGSGDLYMARLDSTGSVVLAPQVISQSFHVGSYDVALDGNGEPIVWYGGTRSDPGLYALRPARPDAELQLVDAEGISPSLATDHEGNLHVVWLRYPAGETSSTFYYAFYANANWQPGAAAPVAEELISTTSTLVGPLLGLTDDTVYLFWTVEVRTGLQAGLVETSVATLRPGRPDTITAPTNLHVPAAFELPYTSGAEGVLRAGARVKLEEADANAVPRDLSPNRVAESEMVVALRAEVTYQLRKQASQVGLLYFRDGVASDYQLVSFTRTRSDAPYVVSDTSQYLYLSWLEPGEESGFQVYVSSTAPDISAALGAVSAADVGRMAIETLFGMLAGVALSPFMGILWMVLPLVVLGLTSFLRRESDRRISVGSVISLTLALGGYWLVKLLTLPGFGSYVPFSAWIPILPAWSKLPLQWGILPLILLAALVVAWRYTYGRETQSGLYFLLIYTAVDAPLTLAIYGAIIYGFI